MGRMRDNMLVHGKKFRDLTVNEQFNILMPQLTSANLARLQRMAAEAEAGRSFDLISVVQLMLDRQLDRQLKALAAHPVPRELRAVYDGAAEYAATMHLGTDEASTAVRIEVRKDLIARARRSAPKVQDEEALKLKDRDLYAIFADAMPSLPDDQPTRTRRTKR